MSDSATRFAAHPSDFPHTKTRRELPVKLMLAVVSGVAFASLTLNVYLLTRPVHPVQVEQTQNEFKSGALVMVNPPDVSVYAAGALGLGIGK